MYDDDHLKCAYISSKERKFSDLFFKGIKEGI